MLSSAQIKYIKSLQQKKIRDTESVFVAESPKIVEDFLDSNNIFTVKEIFALASWVEVHWKRYAKYTITEITSKELDRISGLITPYQVLAIIEKPNKPMDYAAIFNDCCLILDDIRDPGNFGTIIRVADWFGIQAVICSNQSVESTNPKCVQASMGSLAHVDIFYTNLEDFLSKKPKNYPVYGTFMNGESIYETSLEHRCGIVIGNEAHGISKPIEQLVTKKIHIPSFSQNEAHAESLNASIATAIVCSELKGRT